MLNNVNTYSRVFVGLRPTPRAHFVRLSTGVRITFHEYNLKLC